MTPDQLQAVRNKMHEATYNSQIIRTCWATIMDAFCDLLQQSDNIKGDMAPLIADKHADKLAIKLREAACTRPGGE